jgi:hypothetical protein
MRNLTAYSFALLFLFALTTSAKQRGADLVKATPERRVALVIGNAAYETAPLANPINDAKNMADALESFGFDVIRRNNLKRDEMENVIRAFGAKLRTSDVALFYYAGHGLQVSKVNYLVPVDAKIETEGAVKRECISAEFVLEQMEGPRDRTNIVILDACRNNPFARGRGPGERGLAPMDAPIGTLVAYATKSGSVTPDDSLYTRELLRFMWVPGLEVQDVFKKVRASVWGLTKDQERPQMPWIETSLVGEFYFAEPQPSPSPTPTVSPNELLNIIKSEQRSEVRESYGEFRGQNFSDEMLKEFKENNIPKSVVDRLRHDSYFIDVVLAIKRMEPSAREKLLSDGMRTRRKTWAEQGGVSPEAQTEAGRQAEELIAQAIVKLVRELYTMPAEKLDALRK